MQTLEVKTGSELNGFVRTLINSLMSMQALEVNTNTEPWAAVRVLPQAQTENIPGQASTSVVLDNLKKNTFYQAKIKAVNRIGTSDETTFIFRTGSGGGCGPSLPSLLCVHSVSTWMFVGGQLGYTRDWEKG